MMDVSEYTRNDITFELLKQTVSFPDVVQLLGYEIDSSNKIISPFNPDERTASFHCYDDHGYCYATGWHGDVVDLVQALHPEMKTSDIIWKLWHRAIKAGREPGDVEREQPRELVDFTDRLEHEPHPVYTGFVGKTKPPHGAVYASMNELWIPHREPGLVYGIKVRHPDGHKTALPGSQFGHRLYSHWGWGMPLASNVIICEGESDAWALQGVVGMAWDVLALPSGSATWKDHWLDDLKHCTDIRVCMDNDRAGTTAKDKIIRKLGHGRALPLDVPPLMNDAREAIEAGWRPSL